ncbi:hypothetical protein [Bradyrhizobium sp. sGM-13]|uniref:hypothetical protein n=1 Tax=Bradyrhizobium sp. sGM-13 TaxID=2831781 RepID=UPI001BD0CA9C|nr:hypothetical protein [Bradyrhizobium sp. sGM-13]
MKIESYRKFNALLGGGGVVDMKEARHVQVINYVYHSRTFSRIRSGVSLAAGDLLVYDTYQQESIHYLLW